MLSFVRTIEGNVYQNAITHPKVAVFSNWNVIRKKTKNGYFVSTRNMFVAAIIFNITYLRCTALGNENAPVNFSSGKDKGDYFVSII